MLPFLNAERTDAPRFPENYFSAAAGNIASTYLQKASDARACSKALPAFPDEELEALVNNTWGDTGKAIVNNWLGMVYRVTNLDRRLQFMDGIDPDDPLGLR